MTKNKFLKIASLLVMLCLISTCAISTTFAKYTTRDEASDTARVAKWGVRLTVSGDDMLKNSYSNSDNTVTVLSSSSTENVVAPGTSGSSVFSIVGTPEVMTQITIEFNVTEDVWLKAGKYHDATTGANECTLTENYFPVVFTLKQTHNRNGAMQTPVTLATGNLTDIQTFLNTYNANATYAPNTNLAATFELSWAWAFNGNDAADTTLGNLIVDRANSTTIVQKEVTAGGATSDQTPVEGMTGTADYNLDLAYTITITATQVD